MSLGSCGSALTGSNGDSNREWSLVEFDDDGVALADPERDQYFLSAPDKLALLVAAAGILPTDHVVEVGAGIGSVAGGFSPRARA